MTTYEFTLPMFLDALDLHGGDIASWPGPLQAQATELLSRSLPARESLDAMLRVERYLDRTRLHGSLAAGAIAAAAMQKRQDRPHRMVTRWVPWTVAGTIALAAGVFVGFVTLPVAPQDYLGAALVQTDTSDVW